jgi:hypothetical protein
MLRLASGTDLQPADEEIDPLGNRRAVRDEDRLFVRSGRRTYRRRFSRVEPRWSALVLVVLAAVGGWVAWKGAHPDPELFSAGFEAGAPVGADVAMPGWRTGAVAQYDSSNLYEKIDGREDYYKSFGFRRLHWVSLVAEDAPETTVDIELFDLGNAANALGAYAGERSPDAAARVEASGLWHRARNAVFATTGRYYARLVGADESAPVLAQLEHARRALQAALPGEPLPWGYALFAGGMGLDPGRIAYFPENAFSFGFAPPVFVARPDASDLELFAAPAAAAGAASELATRFVQGFQQYGDDAGADRGHRWVRDRYLGTLATAAARGAWVIGVRGAPDPARAAAALAGLEKAIGALPGDVVSRARSEAAGGEAAGPADEPGL